MDNTHALVEQIQQLGDRERRIVLSLLRRRPVTRDWSREFREGLTLGQRVADRVATFGGSWTFIFIFLTAMAVWMLINQQSGNPFDPYPFILLNLVLSCLAALQAPVIMMSQNRQATRDRLDARHDYEVNLKAEMEIMALHAKIDQLRESQWEELVRLQRLQIDLLEQIRGSQPPLAPPASRT